MSVPVHRRFCTRLLPSGESTDRQSRGSYQQRGNAKEQGWQGHDFWSTILRFPAPKVARLSAFALRTDPPAIETLTRSCHAKNPGFAERRRIFHLARLWGDDHRQREGAGWGAIQRSVRAGSEYEDQDHRQCVVPKRWQVQIRQFARRRIRNEDSGDWVQRGPAHGRNTVGESSGLF